VSPATASASKHASSDAGAGADKFFEKHQHHKSMAHQQHGQQGTDSSELEESVGGGGDGGGEADGGGQEDKVAVPSGGRENRQAVELLIVY
jgi:hypothetical protein